MQVSNTVVVLALHEIFDRFGVYSGGSLSLLKVENAWTKSGMLKSDLDEGIVNLIREGHLAVELTGDGPAVKLLSYALPKAGAEGDDAHASRGVIERVRSRRRPPDPESE